MTNPRILYLKSLVGHLNLFSLQKLIEWVRDFPMDVAVKSNLSSQNSTLSVKRDNIFERFFYLESMRVVAIGLAENVWQMWKWKATNIKLYCNFYLFIFWEKVAVLEALCVNVCCILCFLGKLFLLDKLLKHLRKR